MNRSKKEKLRYRVRFHDGDPQKPRELVVNEVRSSEFIGLVTLDGMVFSDQTKQIVLPDEEAAQKRFGKTERLHIPYHNLLFVEEFYDAPVDLRKLPFIRDC